MESPTRQSATEQAALEQRYSYVGFSAVDERWLEAGEWIGELARNEVVCFGATSGAPLSQVAAVELTLELLRRATISGRRIALALQEFDSSAQAQLTRFVRSEITLPELFDSTEFAKHNGHEGRGIEPLLTLGRQGRVELWAAGAGPKRGEEPQTHPAGVEQGMAQTIEGHLNAPHSAYQVLVMATHEACQSTRLPAMLESHLPVRVVSVEPWMDNTPMPESKEPPPYTYRMVIRAESEATPQ